MHRKTPWVALALSALLTPACGDDTTGPATDVTLGETTIVALVNPSINTANGVTLAAPGTTRAGIDLSWGGGSQVRTDAQGVAVLSGIAAGSRALSANGAGLTGSVTANIAEKDLHEIALALTPSGAAIMANLRYAFGGEVVEITSSTPLAQVNAQLARSNIVVLMRGGSYSGNLLFSGSNVTLFGAGARGGEVTIDGDVRIEGSSNRIRGARILRNVTVVGSNAGISFSQVVGSFSLSGSGAVLLNNAFCGQVSITGSNPTVLGNAGVAPLGAPSGGC